MTDHFEPLSIEHALQNNLLPQPCCPKTYYTQNDNENDEEFEEDCPACKEAGYLERDYLDKLDKQCDDLKKMNDLNNSIKNLTLHNNSKIESVGNPIMNIISGFMNAFITPMINDLTSSTTEEVEEVVEEEIKKVKKVFKKIKKSYKIYGRRIFLKSRKLKYKNHKVITDI